jgi:CelD/BcsL family acetyltransferase involved in cellulose biosynthesis
LKPRPAQLLDAVIFNKEEDFAALEEDWEDLYQNSPHATPFQTWAWLYSWWEFYGEGYELRLITMRDDTGLLVGLIPLMLERRGGFGRLLFIGTGITDYLDILAREGWEDGVTEVGIGAFRSMDSWHVADLHELRPTAAAWTIFRTWVGPRLCVWQSNSMVVETKPWDELLMSLAKKQRYETRRYLKRAEEDGVRCESASLIDAEVAARRMLALHREQWQGRRITPEHLRKRFESHLAVASRRMTEHGLARLYEFWRDAEVISSQLVILGKDFVGRYLFGASKDALRRYQTNSLHVWNALDVARARNNPCMSLLRGEDPYKLWWKPRVVPNYRIVLGWSSVLFGPYAGYVVLRSRAARYVKSENTPTWVKGAATRLERFLPL